MFRPRIDPCILLLLTTVAVASLLPARGIVAVECAHATTLDIGLLFFLSGARLSTRAAIAGLRHWRLHGLVLAFTFLVFPVLGLIFPVLGLICRRRVRMDRDFYRGASDEALITKFVERSAPYDAALEHAARTSNVRMIRINGDEPPDTVCTPVLNAIT